MLQKSILLLLMLLAASAASGQKTARDYLRSGNKLYKDFKLAKETSESNESN